MKYLTQIISLFCLCLIGCSQEVTVGIDNFVVEGFIVANEAVDNIKIKAVSPFNDEELTSSEIADATVEILYEGNVYPLNYNEITRKYENLNESLNIAYNNEYSIEIRVDERIATSSTIVPNPPTGLQLSANKLSIPQLTLNFNLGSQISTLFEEERILLEWDAIDGQSFFVVIENKANTIDSILPEEVPESARELLSSFRFISAPSEETSFEIIAVALETYGLHVAKVYTVNQEYVDLYNNTEQDSRDLNEPPSNISNALGIFTAFAVDSITFNVVKP